MKVFVVMIMSLSFNVFANEIESCNYASRAQVGEVKINGLGEGKVSVVIGHIDYIQDKSSTYKYVGYELQEADTLGGMYSLNKEKLFKLISNNGELAELAIEFNSIDLGSRVPCHEGGRAQPSNCGSNTIITKVLKLKSDSLNIKAFCDN